MANRIYFAQLDSGQKVEEKYLPSYVDDVLEFENLEAFPETGETGKIYVALDSNFTYRWSGSTYVFIGNEFNLSDRIAKGVDTNGNVVSGAVIEGEISGSYANVASGLYAHAEGAGTTASGNSSHSEGGGSQATGDGSHAEGSRSKATGTASHAEGWLTTASGDYSHAEGSGNIASGNNSHAEGNGSSATAPMAHASGCKTKASRKSQFVIGEYNVEDTTGEDETKRGDYVFIIGNGTADDKRADAFAVKWDGTFVFADGTEITPAQFASLKALLNT